MTQLPDLLTSAQAAEYIGCALVTIRQNVHRGNLKPKMKLANTYLFSRSQIERFRRKFLAKK